MYITGMSTEHCTIFSVISGLHDSTNWTTIVHSHVIHCRPTPENLPDFSLTDLATMRSLILFPYVEVLLLTALHTGCHE